VLLDADGFRGARRGSLAELVEWAEPVAAVGVDIPIGEEPGRRRRADDEARRFVGARRASVFAAPPVQGLRVDDYDAANRALAAAGRPRMSRQAWALVPKMREAASLAAADPRLHEVHPEVCFRHLHGAELAWPKRSWNGVTLRRSLLRSAGVELPEPLEDVGATGVDDVLDAAVVAWSARRIALGRARTLPADPPVHDGRAVAIWY
jgi:predicted RNase H-like nuclease